MNSVSRLPERSMGSRRSWFAFGHSRELLVKLLASLALVTVIAFVAMLVCPEVLDYLRTCFCQDLGHLTTFSIGVYICRLVFTPASLRLSGLVEEQQHMNGQRRAATIAMSKIRIP